MLRFIQALYCSRTRTELWLCSINHKYKRVSFLLDQEGFRVVWTVTPESGRCHCWPKRSREVNPVEDATGSAVQNRQSGQAVHHESQSYASTSAARPHWHGHEGVVWRRFDKQRSPGGPRTSRLVCVLFTAFLSPAKRTTELVSDAVLIYVLHTTVNCL